MTTPEAIFEATAAALTPQLATYMRHNKEVFMQIIRKYADGTAAHVTLFLNYGYWYVRQEGSAKTPSWRVSPQRGMFDLRQAKAWTRRYLWARSQGIPYGVPPSEK